MMKSIRDLVQSGGSSTPEGRGKPVGIRRGQAEGGRRKEVGGNFLSFDIPAKEVKVEPRYNPHW